MPKTRSSVLISVWLAAWGCSEASSTKPDASKPDASSWAHDAAVDASRSNVDAQTDAGGQNVGDGPVLLPRGAPGIEYDDIQFGAGLRKVIVPAGRTGSVVLIDPDTSAVTEIKGLSSSDEYTPVPGQAFVRVGPRFGSTAATEAGKYVAAIDGTAQTLNILDPVAATIVASVALHGPSDYVHYVPSMHELWITNPTGASIEFFSVPTSGEPIPEKVGTVAIAGGPESLAIDETRGRAYTNAFVGGMTFVVDLKTRMIVETWTNGCGIALGVTIDEERGFAFVSCGENGDVVALDAKNGGAALSRLNGGFGTNIIAYNSTLKHLYSSSGNTQEVFVMDVSDSGELTLLGKLPGADRGFSVAADDRGHVWVIDPDHGQVLRATDDFPVQ